MDPSVTQIAIQVLLTTAATGIVTVVAQRNLERFKTNLTGDLAKQSRRAEYLRDQICQLYGPLSFCLEQSSLALQVNRQISTAYDEYFRGAGQARANEMDEVIATANIYVQKMIENNRKGADLLSLGWGWLDPDDIPGAVQYLTDVARIEVEHTGKNPLPPLMYVMGEEPLSPPGLHRPDFAKRIRESLTRKQHQLEGVADLSRSTK